MQHNLYLSINGSTKDDSDKEVSNMSISLNWTYDPIALMKLVNDKLPELKGEVERFIAQVVIPTPPASNSSAPQGEASNGETPFAPAEAACDLWLDEEEDEDEIIVP